MSKAATVGLDLAKDVFQAHGADASGRAVLRRKPQRAGAGVFLSAAGLRCRDGGVWRRTFRCADLRFRGREPGKLRHEVRPASLRQAFREASE